MTRNKILVTGPYALFAIAALLLSAGAIGCPAGLEAAERYEYKLLPLGSLSSLQKESSAANAKLSETENTLNMAGLDGWEMVSIFAVRTTFDPNVFFAVMKRQISDRAEGVDGQ
jgi:hypothetical protein